MVIAEKLKRLESIKINDILNDVLKELEEFILELNKVQFGNKSFWYSPRITVGGNDRDTVFAAPSGSLAFLSYVDDDARNNRRSGDAEWSEQFLPLVGINVGLLLTKGCADLSSLGGGATSASLKENWMFSFDYSFVTAYDSGTLGTSIFKANFTKA